MTDSQTSALGSAVWIFLIPTITFWFLYAASKDLSGAWLRVLGAALDRISERIRSGEVYWLGDDVGVPRPSAGASDMGPEWSVGFFPPDLKLIIDKAWNQGAPIANRLMAFADLLRREADYEDGRKGLCRLFAWRVIAALGFATAARVGFFRAYVDTGEDVMTCLLGCAMAGAMQKIFVKAMQKSWVLAPPRRILGGRRATSWARNFEFASMHFGWNKAQSQLSPESLAWLQASLDGELTACTPCGESLRYLRDRELARGVSLVDEKQRTLWSWSVERHRQQEAKLRKITDLMPLIELLGAGVPATLILLHPMLGLVK